MASMASMHPNTCIHHHTQTLYNVKDFWEYYNTDLNTIACMIRLQLYFPQLTEITLKALRSHCTYRWITPTVFLSLLKTEKLAGVQIHPNEVLMQNTLGTLEFDTVYDFIILDSLKF